MLRTLFVLPVLGLLLLPAVSQAVVEHDYGFNAGNWDLTLSGSAANDQDFNQLTATANVGVGYFLSNVLEIGIRQGATYDDTGSKQWKADARTFVDLYWDLGQWQPFIGANGGWRYGDAQKNTGIYGPEAGVKYFLTTSAYAFFSVGYDRQCHQDRLSNGKLIDGLFVYSLGLGCKL